MRVLADQHMMTKTDHRSLSISCDVVVVMNLKLSLSQPGKKCL